jgi:hypothetical protein
MSLAAVLNPATNLIEVYGVGVDGYPYYVTQKTPGNWGDAPTWQYLGPASPLKDQPRIFSRLAAIVNQKQERKFSDSGRVSCSGIQRRAAPASGTAIAGGV